MSFFNSIFEDDRKYKIFMSIMCSLLAILVVFSLFFQVVIIEGSSMEPNFKDGDKCLVQKSWLVKEYERNDVVILKMPKAKKLIIKRIIGMPNEHIEVNNGSLYINFEKLDEPFETLKDDDYIYPYIVNEASLKSDELFLLGDNRDNSTDSGMFGPVKIKDIKGKFLFKIWASKK